MCIRDRPGGVCMAVVRPEPRPHRFWHRGSGVRARRSETSPNETSEDSGHHLVGHVGERLFLFGREIGPTLCVPDLDTVHGANDDAVAIELRPFAEDGRDGNATLFLWQF